MESPHTHGLSINAISTKKTGTQDPGDPNALVLLLRAGSGLTVLS